MSSGYILSVSGCDWLLSLAARPHCNSPPARQNFDVSQKSITGECHWFHTVDSSVHCRHSDDMHDALNIISTAEPGEIICELVV